MCRVLVRKLAALGGCLALVVLFGCAGSVKLAQVEGKVTVDGEDANSGEVVFAGKGLSVAGMILPDGRYRAVGVPAGLVKVAVRSGPASKDGKEPPPGMKDLPGAKDASAPVEKPVTIPEKYNDPESSGLSVNLKIGPNKFDVKLTSN
jgi:hypothetical protein